MCGHDPLHGIHIYPGDYRPMENPAYTPAPVATTPCPHCQNPAQEDFVFCPQCGAELLKACPACHRAVRAEWTHCAFCGADLTERESVKT